MLDDHRLGIFHPVGAGGGVASVPQGEVAGEAIERQLVKGLGNQSDVLVHPQASPVAGRDAGAFLAAMLQRVEAEIGEVRHLFPGRIDAEEAAGLLHALVAEPVAPQNAVSQAWRRASSGTRTSAPTWKSSPPTTPMA